MTTSSRAGLLYLLFPPAPPAYGPRGPGSSSAAGPDGRRMPVSLLMSLLFGGLNFQPSGGALQSRPPRTF